MTDRRVGFFLIGAMVAAVLALISPDDVRMVPIVVAIAYAVLALLVFLDSRSGLRSHQ